MRAAAAIAGGAAAAALYVALRRRRKTDDARIIEVLDFSDELISVQQPSPNF